MAIEHIEIGDRHSGKATMLVRDGADEYIYKPRSAKTERAWETFLRELQAEGLLFAPSCPHVLREGEGFHEVEVVRQSPAADVDEAKNYYRSCGTLLFLTYLLNSNDLHCENLIAAGNVPVLVDLETLLTGEIDDRREYKKLLGLADSVIYSHLLPNFALDGEESIDVGGITGSNAESKNILFLDGKRQMSYNYIIDILHGFTLAYRFAQEKRELVAEKLRLFEQCRFRQLLRPTETYSKIIAVVGHFDGEKKQQAAYELLSRAYERDIDPQRLEKMSAVLAEEVSAVCNGDIPLFYAPGDSLDLFADDERLFCGFLTLSPVGKALSRLELLSEADLQSQSKIILQVLSAIQPALCRKSSLTDALGTVEKALETAYIPSLASGYMLLCIENSGNVFFRSAGPGLYSGISGMMCCCAAIYRKTGSTFSRSLLSRLLEMYDSIMFTNRGIPLSFDNCSLSEGVAGQLAALLHTAELIEDDSICERAIRLAGRLLASKTEAVGDVLGGLCGLALQLPKLPAELAKPLAQALFEPISLSEPTLTGTAHGAAGVALAAAAIQTVLGTDSLNQKILSLLEWENGLYDNERHNWQDLRRREPNGFVNGWCSGAPGIAMARKRLNEYCADNRVQEICKADIERALDTKAPSRDSLCCGSSSVLVSASFVGREAEEMRSQLEKRVTNGTLRLFHPLDTEDNNCSLMQGLAGVGYALAMYGSTDSGNMLI